MKLIPILAAGAAARARTMPSHPRPRRSIRWNWKSLPFRRSPPSSWSNPIRAKNTSATSANSPSTATMRKRIFPSTENRSPSSPPATPFKCDQIFHMNLDGTNLQLISTGKGRTTCSYFMPDGKRIIYASTHLTSPDCPPPADKSKGYVWAVYPSFKIFSAKPDGTDMKQLTFAPGYNAEATIAPNGKKIVFTSSRDGDLELYDMDLDGSHQRRLTHALGYDGGAWHSHDSQWIVWRANRPTTPAEIKRIQGPDRAESGDAGRRWNCG